MELRSAYCMSARGLNGKGAFVALFKSLYTHIFISVLVRGVPDSWV